MPLQARASWPAVRALRQQAHASRCKAFEKPHMPSLEHWYECLSLDACLAAVARDVTYVRATVGGERKRIISCSDDFSSRRGDHWFTVAYHVRRRAVP